MAVRKLAVHFPALDRIHQRLSAAVRGYRCLREGVVECDGWCCRFTECRYEPWVWQLELERIREYLTRRGRPWPAWPQAGNCLFLDERNSCSIYPVRPAACRLHYCMPDGFPQNMTVDEHINSIIEQLKHRCFLATGDRRPARLRNAE